MNLLFRRRSTTRSSDARLADLRESGNLDFLRSAAVLSVVIYHLANVWRHDLENLFSPVGRFGVLLFFVHTSLVLMMSLERSDRAGTRLVAPFYIRRLFRIYPLCVVCIAAVLIFQIPALPLTSFKMPSIHDLLANLALVQNVVKAQMIIGPVWSLPYEVQMYLFLPFVYLAIRKANSALTAILMWVIAYTVGVLLYVSEVPGISEYFLPCFLAGCLAYSLSKRASLKLPSWIWMAAIPVLAVGFVEVSLGITVTRYGKIVIQPLLCLFVGLLIPQFKEIESTLVLRASKQVAKYSYGIYLLHAPLIIFFFDMHRGWSQYLTVPAFLACVVGLPVAVFWLVEDPMIRVGRAIASRYSSQKASREEIAAKIALVATATGE